MSAAYARCSRAVIVRCPWADAEPLRDYHDGEWGRSVRGDQALFERLCLESFQAGLSWRTVLVRRPALREVFAGFDPERLAVCDGNWIDQALGDPRIIRNRAKVRATVVNAQVYLRLRDDEGPGALDAMIWRFFDAGRARPHRLQDVPSQTPDSTALAKSLKERGFVHIGPTSTYALMQACGVVNDHLVACEFGEQTAT